MVSRFCGIAAEIDKKLALNHFAPGFFLISGMELEDSTQPFVMRTNYRLYVTYDLDATSFHILQTFIDSRLSVRFTVDADGRVVSLHDHLPNPSTLNGSQIDLSKRFSVLEPHTNDVEQYAQSYGERVVAALVRCGVPDPSRPSPSGRSR